MSEENQTNQGTLSTLVILLSSMFVIMVLGLFFQSFFAEPKVVYKSSGVEREEFYKSLAEERKEQVTRLKDEYNTLKLRQSNIEVELSRRENESSLALARRDVKHSSELQSLRNDLVKVQSYVSQVESRVKAEAELVAMKKLTTYKEQIHQQQLSFVKEQTALEFRLIEFEKKEMKFQQKKLAIETELEIAQKKLYEAGKLRKTYLEKHDEMDRMIAEARQEDQEYIKKLISKMDKMASTQQQRPFKQLKEDRIQVGDYVRLNYGRRGYVVSGTVKFISGSHIKVGFKRLYIPDLEPSVQKRLLYY